MKFEYYRCTCGWRGLCGVVENVTCPDCGKSMPVVTDPKDRQKIDAEVKELMVRWF